MQAMNGNRRPPSEAELKAQAAVVDLANLVQSGIAITGVPNAGLLIAMTTVQARELQVLRSAVVELADCIAGRKPVSDCKIDADEIHRRMELSCRRAIEDINGRPKIEVASGVVRPNG